MDEKPWWQKILSNGFVWGAFLAWANGLVGTLWPQVPQNMVTLTNVLIGAILAALGIKDVVVPAIKQMLKK